MGETTRVIEKGQATIPKSIREKYDLEPGDEVRWVDTEEGIVVRKASRREARGMLVPEDTSVETREAVAEELERRVDDDREEIESRLDDE